MKQPTNYKRDAVRRIRKPARQAVKRANMDTLLNQVHHMRDLELLTLLPDESVDLVVTSPPYNLGLKGEYGSKWRPQLSKGYDRHDDNLPHAEYVAWQRRVLSECLRVINPTGAIFYNHKKRVQGGLLQTRDDILVGFPVRQEIIWNRGGGVNFNRGYFVPSYESIYLITKPQFSLTLEGVRFGDVWNIAPESNNPHPAPFPLELAERCIISTTAQVIVDPYLGSGTTALAAKRLGRDFIGCDQSAAYVAQARKRIAHYTPDMFATIGRTA